MYLFEILCCINIPVYFFFIDFHVIMIIKSMRGSRNFSRGSVDNLVFGGEGGIRGLFVNFTM